MSNWSGITGTIYNHEVKKFSVRKAVEQLFEGEDYIFKFHNETGYFTLSLESDGQQALNSLLKFKDILQKNDIRYDLNISVIWCS